MVLTEIIVLTEKQKEDKAKECNASALFKKNKTIPLFGYHFQRQSFFSFHYHYHSDLISRHSYSCVIHHPLYKMVHLCYFLRHWTAVLVHFLCHFLFQLIKAIYFTPVYKKKPSFQTGSKFTLYVKTSLSIFLSP